jgi:hypothetical protein
MEKSVVKNITTGDQIRSAVEDCDAGQRSSLCSCNYGANLALHSEGADTDA